MRTAQLVLTPGGFRHSSLVHHVPSDHEVRHTATVQRIRELKTGLYKTFSQQAILPGEVPALSGGWICYAWWTNNTGSPIQSFETTWTVPPPPASPGAQTVFLFNGIDPLNTSDGILQPVLQWGESAIGGGPWWAVASWYVAGDGHAYHSDLVPVNPGDTLVGRMTLTNAAGNGLFDYTSQFVGIANTQLAVPDLPELVWCNETLEAYGIAQCSDYPAGGGTTLSQISVQTANGLVAVPWTRQVDVQNCNQNVTLDTGGSILLSY